MGPCRICRFHAALPCPWVPTLPAGQNPALAHPHITPLPTGLSPAHCHIPTCRFLPCAWVSFPPAALPGPAHGQISNYGCCLRPLHPVLAHRSIPTHGHCPAPRPLRAYTQNRGSGRRNNHRVRERHMWMALGTRPPAPSASPFERPRELPQTRGLGEWEPLTPLGKCWVAFGAQGGEGGSNSSA